MIHVLICFLLVKSPSDLHFCCFSHACSSLLRSSAVKAVAPGVLGWGGSSADWTPKSWRSQNLFKILHWLVVEPPLWKIWKSIGMITPNIWKNKKCSKPPTRLDSIGKGDASNSEWFYYSNDENNWKRIGRCWSKITQIHMPNTWSPDWWEKKKTVIPELENIHNNN